MSILNQIDELGAFYRSDPVERPQRAEKQARRPNRRDVWGEAQWREMQAIWRGERDGEQP